MADDCGAGRKACAHRRTKHFRVPHRRETRHFSVPHRRRTKHFRVPHRRETRHFCGRSNRRPGFQLTRKVADTSLPQLYIWLS